MNFISEKLFGRITSKIEKSSGHITNEINQLKQINRNYENRIIILESLIRDIHENLLIENRCCPICNNEFEVFQPFGEKLRSNAQCPICGSLERHRLIYLYINEKTDLFNRENIKLLHFAPEKFFYNIFSKSPNIDYLPVDVNPVNDMIKEKMDIQDIHYPDNIFDAIICIHVLEHIPNDKKAIMELHRVLKPNGWAVLHVPLNNNSKTTLENPEYNTSALRSKYYWQNDHLRLYGLDFKNRLEEGGFKVKVDEYSEIFDKHKINKYGLPIKENVYYCTK